MNTILSFVLSCACLTAGAPGAAQSGLREQAAKADLIVIAEVVEVGESPGIWGGYLSPKQSVIYREVEVLKGSLNRNRFEVGFYITSVSSRVAKDRPRLSPEIFAAGKRHVLLLKSAAGESTSNKVPILTEQGKVVLKDVSEVNEAAGSRKVPVATEAGNISFEDASEHNKLYAFEPVQVITVLTADANTIETLRNMISEK
jgi:hypothetical protein